MPRTRECDYCGDDIEPGTGTLLVRNDGSTVDYCSSKCEKNADLGREPREVEWTASGQAAGGPATQQEESESEPEPETEEADDSEAAPDLEAAEEDAEADEADAEDEDEEPAEADEADADAEDDEAEEEAEA